MEFDFLRPVAAEVIKEAADFQNGSLGHKLRVHTEDLGFPDIEGVQLAFFSVAENRRHAERSQARFNFNDIRLEFYKLFPGNWQLEIADLGDIVAGSAVEDTYFAVRELTTFLIEQEVIPIILGGSQDLVYAQYRAYDNYGKMVNLVNIDSKFDLGDAEAEISNTSFVGRMVVDQPYNLFNYANLGYQTYFNAQEEIALMQKLFFEAYRLGEVSNDISLAEPVMRDADLVSLDIGAVASSLLGAHNPPNGFTGKEICALSRYAGISDKLTSFGMYELETMVPEKSNFMLIAQIFWYFVEGVNYRKNEHTSTSKNKFTTYRVPIDEEVLVFYKSEISGRWWIEIPHLSHINNKLKKSTLLPCTPDDYLEACNQNIPERWYKACRKNEV